ncbi:MAG: 3-keto-5-aminohexanoate cleavage protein [Clostridiales bacterium]|nr:3-keto-5-aminohexanoate cleavage protein [Clostridiales bacterium]
MRDKVIITAALTGAMTPKELNEHIPLTPEEIAADAYACWKAGAAVVHLHVRDDNGIGEMNKEKFAEVIRLLRGYKDCDVIINCTTAGEAEAPDEKRLAHVRELDGIEIVSYDAGSFNWMPAGVHTNSPKFLKELGNICSARDIKPEYEIFDSGMMGIVDYYVDKGNLKTPGQYCFVLGVKGGMDATVENLVFLKSKLPEGSTWNAFGVGKAHLPIMYATLALGGDIRVGLEDNVYYSRGVKATNQMLVERAVRVIREFGKEPATPAQAREILGLKPLAR